MTKTLVAVFGLIGLFAVQDYAEAQAPAPAAGAPGAKRPPVRRKVIRKPAPGTTPTPPPMDSLGAPADLGAGGTAIPQPADATATAGAAAAPVVGSDAMGGAPYKMRVGFGLSVSGGSTSSTTKTDAGELKADGNLPTEFDLGVAVGYLISPKLEIGGSVSVGYSSEKEKSGETEVTQTSTTFGIGLEPRFYFFDINTNKIVPYVGGKIGYSMTSNSTSPAGETKVTGPSGLVFGVELGCNYFLTRHVALSGAFEFNMMMLTTTTDTSGTKVETSTTATKFNYLKGGLSIYL